MPAITATLEAPIHHSFRVAQVAGMFDVPLCDRMLRLKKCEVPGLDEDWRIGLIVGPSGSGKTTIARAAFGDAVYSAADWPADRAILEGFGDVPAKQIVHTLTAVGFSSPPAWLRPYQTLSTGERFRCDLARALLGPVRSNRLQPVPGPSRKPAEADYYEPVVFDEFTSVVDRNVARVTSAAVAKQIRRGRLPVRFVAVTCHDDVAEWLEPDWILDMGSPQGELSGTLSRRRLRRPSIELRIYRAGRAAWPTFAPHHYLSGELHKSARCYVGTVGLWDRETVGLEAGESPETSSDAQRESPARDSPSLGPTVPRSYGLTVQPATFAATLPLVGRTNHRRFHRLVVLPDYQGIGIGSRFLDAVADLHREEGLRINIATSHPAIAAHCRASPQWRTVYMSRHGRKPRLVDGRIHAHSLGRAVASFEYASSP